MLTEYLERRSTEVDYSSLTQMAVQLARNFWKSIESIDPEQADLRLSEDTYNRWRTAIAVLESGRPRLYMSGILMTVPAMYFDIHAWAVHEPERRAEWSVPSPIPRRDLRAITKRRDRVRERTHGKIRVLQPLLPILVDHVEARHEKVAGPAAPGPSRGSQRVL